MAQRDMGRQIQTAAALLEAAQNHKFNAIVFNKAMFYTDLVALRDLGKTITGSTYTAAPQGPMLTNFRDLVSVLSDKGIAKQVSEGDSEPICALNTAAVPPLPEAEIAIARLVGRDVSSWTSGKATYYSHENPGWIAGQTAPLKRINLLTAMQQLVDDDPWIDEPCNEQEIEAVRLGVSGASIW
jgi:hypothetical protein